MSVKVSGLSIGSVLLAGLAHVPCCGLNVALLVGSASSGSVWLEGLTPYRGWFMGFSVAMAALTLFFAFRPHREKACGECCPGEPSHSRKQHWRKVWAVSVAVLALAGFLVSPADHHHDHSSAEAHASR